MQVTPAAAKPNSDCIRSRRGHLVCGSGVQQQGATVPAAGEDAVTDNVENIMGSDKE